MDWLNKIIKLSIFSGYVKCRTVVSLMIVANPSCGKTRVLQQYTKNKDIVECVDFTGYGIREKIIPQMRKDGTKFILIPDFIKTMMKTASVSWDSVSTLSNLIEEGYTTSANYKGEFNPHAERFRAGILTTITPSFLNQYKKKFSQMGFLQRILCIHYTYSSVDIKEIIEIDNDYEDTDIILDVPIHVIDVKFERKKLNLKEYENELYIIANTLTINKIEENGIRLSKILKTLMKSNALINNRTEVIQEDVDEIYSLMRYIYRGL